jgi:hypothetical protein
MRSSLLVVLTAVTAVTGVVVLACSSSTDSTDAGGFGCCPDVQTDCNLRRYGLKSTATDDCSGGHDGIIPDPSQPGWTHGTDANGCAFWSPPADAKRIQCGVAPSRDAGDAASDAPNEDASDAPNEDASDAASD